MSLFIHIIWWKGPLSLYTTEGKEGLAMFGTQIPLPPMDEKKKVIEDVDKDRRYAIDASIVRIMKSRKVLPHQQLVLECIEQLGRMFKASFFLFLCCSMLPPIIVTTDQGL
jgi:hypothetical protein